MDLTKIIESSINHGMADQQRMSGLDRSVIDHEAIARKCRQRPLTFPIPLEMLRGCECRQMRRLHWMLGTGWAKTAWWLKK